MDLIVIHDMAIFICCFVMTCQGQSLNQPIQNKIIFGKDREEMFQNKLKIK